MARLMSQIKGGYYAADPVAVAAVLERLRPPSSGECVILDPCAGEGHALLQLAQGLQAVPYGIELSEDRAALVRDSLPEGQSLAPADFLRCAISYRSFSCHFVQSALRLRHGRRRQGGNAVHRTGRPSAGRQRRSGPGLPA